RGLRHEHGEHGGRGVVGSDELDGVELPDKLFFRIGEVSELVGVEAHVLRYWESEFRLRPQRSSSGQRMYRRKDIARFLRIRKLLHEEGFTIAGARKALSGGAAEPTSADPTRLLEALERVTELRARIAALRDRYASTGVDLRHDER